MTVKKKMLMDYSCEKLPERPANGSISMDYYITGARMYKPFFAAQREECSTEAKVVIQQARKDDRKRAQAWEPDR